MENNEFKSEILEHGSTELLKLLKNVNSERSLGNSTTQVKTDEYSSEIPTPYNFATLAELYEINVYHARCIHAKAALCTMLGYSLITDDENKDEDKDYQNIKEFFNRHFEYADQDFLKTLNNVVIDRLLFGSAYLEVIRNIKGEVSSFYHIPAQDTVLVKKNNELYLKQEINGKKVLFKKFGSPDKDPSINEFIQIKNYTPRSSYYGVPEYVSNIASIVLDRSAIEYNARRFENNLFIDKIITLIGAKFGKATKASIKQFFSNNFKGVQNAGKTLLLELEDASKDNTDIKFENVSGEQKEGAYRMMRQDNKDEIIAAHGMLPRLLGIMSASQLGGGNEAKEQMRITRDITIRPLQKEVEHLINNHILKSAFPENKKWRFELETFDINDATEDAAFYTSIMNITDDENKKVLTSDEIRQELGYNPLVRKPIEVKAKELVTGLNELRKQLSE